MPRTARQNAVIRDHRQQSIVNACLVLFSRQGFEAVTINDIVRTSHCSHGLFYHYFTDKDDALEAVINRSLEDMRKFFPWLEKLNGDPYIGLAELTAHLLDILSNDRSNYLVHELNIYVSLHQLKTTRRSKKNEIPLSIDPYESILSAIRKGQSEEQINDNFSAEDLALIYLNLMQGLIVNRIALGPRKFTHPGKDAIMAIFAA